MNTKEIELSGKIERRLEMLHAHTKFGKSVREVVKEFGVCQYTYYYWYHRYEKMGIFGLFNSKRGSKIPHNKTREDVVSKILEAANYHSELDAPEILELFDNSPGYKPSVTTTQRILRSNGLNRPKGRRSKKTMERKRTTIQTQKCDRRSKKRA